MKEIYDKRLNEIDIKIGDKIKVRDETGNNLSNVYRGPYTVISIENENILAEDKNSKEIKIHKNRTVKFYE